MLYADAYFEARGQQVDGVFTERAEEMAGRDHPSELQRLGFRLQDDRWSDSRSLSGSLCIAAGFLPPSSFHLF